jgi:hypothetical protein
MKDPRHSLQIAGRSGNTGFKRVCVHCLALYHTDI